jgi:acetyl esterase/lipase
MSTYKLLDPAIRKTIDAFPKFEFTTQVLPIIRRAESEALVLADALASGVAREEIEVPGLELGQPPVRCLKYIPVSTPGSGAAYLHIHGGGYLLGSPESTDQRNVFLANELGITIVSVDYRLAPEHPAPAGLDDCYAALAWLHDNADSLGIDTARIAIGGESAGGGLAAALAIHARDKGDYPICFQLLTYPMLDDRTGNSEAPADPITGEFVWTREHNQFGWQCYLGNTPPRAPVVPARVESLAALPPAWIGTGALDLFRDENILYAQRLLGVGVSAELIVYPGVCHAFQAAIEAPVTRQFFRDHLQALGRGLGLAANSPKIYEDDRPE